PGILAAQQWSRLQPRDKLATGFFLGTLQSLDPTSLPADVVGDMAAVYQNPDKLNDKDFTRGFQMKVFGAGIWVAGGMEAAEARALESAGASRLLGDGHPPGYEAFVSESSPLQAAARSSPRELMPVPPEGLDELLPTLEGRIPDAAKWIQNEGRVI